MLTYLRNILLSALSHVLPERLLTWLFRWWHGRCFDELDGNVTDDTLHGLLIAMEWGLQLFPAWRKRIQGFKGTIVFTAKPASDGKRKAVHNSAVFDGTRMRVLHTAATPFSAKVEFSNPCSFFAFLMSRSHGIVDALLTNSVETTGNLNYVYRFGFLVVEMTRWLRMPA